MIMMPGGPQHLGPGPQGNPRQLMAMLATLMLNKKLQTGRSNQPPKLLGPTNMSPPSQIGGVPNQARMSELAKMQLATGRSPSASRYY